MLKNNITRMICCQLEEVSRLHDYPLLPSLPGDAPIHTTAIKTPTICYETLTLHNHAAASPPPHMTLAVFRYDSLGSLSIGYHFHT
jgi:hypothetical protein